LLPRTNPKKYYLSNQQLPKQERTPLNSSNMRKACVEQAGKNIIYDRSSIHGQQASNTA